MQNTEITKNTGFIEAAPKPTSFMAGGETGIMPGKRVDNGDWTKYLPTPEKQNRIYTYSGILYNFDVLACVTFSALNNIEIQIKRMIATGELFGTDLQTLKDLGFFDEQGNFNASDRFTAKMSGTTQAGNTLEKVADSIRSFGLLPEKDWQFVIPQTDIAADWAAYYAEIPQALKDKALRFRDILEIKYEWVVIAGSTPNPVAVIETKLYESPIQIAAPVCLPWNTAEIIKKCDDTRPAHATNLYAYLEGQYFSDFDHYTEFQKKLAWDYYIPYAFRYSVTRKLPAPVMQKPRHTFTVPFGYGTTGGDVFALQEILKFEGFMSKTVLSTGKFYDITATGLQKWQVAHGLLDFQNETDLTKIRFGSKSVAAANAIYS